MSPSPLERMEDAAQSIDASVDTGVPAIVYLDVGLMERMCHRLAVAIFDRADDPIAPFHTRTLALLDSAIQLPRQAIGGRDCYPALLDKAVVLFYGLIKNHAFPNGNKRIAAATLLVFLSVNDRWLQATPEQFFAEAVRIAASDPRDREIELAAFRSWLVDRLITPRTWSDLWDGILRRLRIR